MCPPGGVPRELSPGGCPPGGCPPGGVPRGVSPEPIFIDCNRTLIDFNCFELILIDFECVPRGVSPGGCPPGGVPRGVSPGGCPPGGVPRGVSPGVPRANFFHRTNFFPPHGPSGALAPVFLELKKNRKPIGPPGVPRCVPVGVPRWVSPGGCPPGGVPRANFH
jgi:hypothetical protein